MSVRSPLAARIGERLETLGLSQADLARRAEVDRRLLSRLLKGEQEGIRDEQVIVRVARGLSTTTAWLLGTVPDPEQPVHRPARRLALPGQHQTAVRAPPDAEEIAALSAEAEERESERLRLREAAPEAFFLHKIGRPFLQEAVNKSRHGAGGHRGPIPLYGNGSDMIIRIDDVTQTIERPPLLYGHAGAYALVVGPGSEPRYEAGEVLFAVPGLPLCVRHWVVAVTSTAHNVDDPKARTRAARVCRLVRLMRIGAQLIVPGSDEPETIPLAQLVALHRIVLAGERRL